MFNRAPNRASAARWPHALVPGSAALMLLVLTAAAVTAPAPACADAFTYASTRRQVRAGILVSSALNLPGRQNRPSPENPDPHVFYVLDSRADLKPAGMDFVNPLAPPVVTPEVYQRWFDRDRSGGDPALRPGSAFQVGARVTKNMGAYWEVNLDSASAEDLQQYDLLLLHTHKSNIAFSPDQLEKMRKYVESGGTLWVDNCGGLTFNPNVPFLLNVQFNNGGNNQSLIAIAAPNHPLIAYPYILTPQEIANFGDKNRNDYWIRDSTDVAAPVPGAHTLVPVVWNTRGRQAPSPVQPHPDWRPYVAAGPFGAGRLVFTSQDSGCAINDYVGGYNASYGGNSGTISGETLIAAHPADIKFGYNVASWSTAHTTALGSVHRTSSASERLSPRLVEKWTPPAVTAPGTEKVGGAAFFRHCVYAVDGDLVLHCYDANPARDLDGDNNPDDGIPDLLAGQPYDEIWRQPLAGFGTGSVTGASTPTVIEFYDAAFPTGIGPNGLENSQQRALVVVVLSDGTVVAVRALPRLADPATGFRLAPATQVDWVTRVSSPAAQDYGIPADVSASTMTIPAAAYSEGVLFVSLNTASGGRIAALDPRWGKSAFHPGTDGTNGALDVGATAGASEALVPDDANMPPVVSSPTVGYVRDQVNGASDKMVYVHVRASGSTGTGGQALAESVRSFWFGAKAERLTPAGGSNFRSRSTLPWFIIPDPLNPGNANMTLRQRVFFTYTDPATGVTQTQELTYAASNPTAGQYSLTYNPSSPVLVTVPGPVLGHNATDEGVAILADYTINWSSSNTTPARPNSRSTFVAPDVMGTGSTIGGAPALSSGDVMYFTSATAAGAGAVNAGRGVLFAVSEQTAPRSQLRWAYTMHNGYSFELNGETVTVPPRLRQLDPILPGVGAPVVDVQFMGTPAVRDGVVYAVARGVVAGTPQYPVSVLCAFKAEPELVLRLGQVIPSGVRVRVGQMNVVTSQGQQGQQGMSLVWLVQNQNYRVEPGSGNIYITSTAPQGSIANFVSTSMPFIVQIGTEPARLVYGTQTDVIGNSRQTRMVGPEGVDNLLWYAVFPAVLPPSLGPSPGLVSSSPTVQGDVLWLGSSGGYIASFDADPSARDPQFQMKGAQIELFTGGTPHLRWVQYVDAPVLASPIAAEGMLAVAAAKGVRSYGDTHTVIADARRVVEVNAAGEAVWSCDGTRTYTVAGGELPLYLVDPNGNVNPANGANATGVPTVHRVPLSRPSVVRKLGLNDFVVVDTGNNRVLQMDRGGNTVWEVHRLFDDYKGLLRPGDPLTLNEPTDIAYWTDYQPTGISYVVDGRTVTYAGPTTTVHYLIADTGNFRVVELVDVYDRNGRPVQPLVNGSPAPFYLVRQLNFVSASYGVQGKRYRYRSAQRYVVRNGSLPETWRTPGKGADDPVALTLSVISNAKLVDDTGNPAAGLNTFGESSEAGGGSLVIMNEAGAIVSVVSNLRVPDASAPSGFRLQPMVNPTFFAKFDELVAGPGGPTLVYKYLLCDANGVYQLVVNATDSRFMDVEWMLSAADYYWMTGKRLQASSVQRLTMGAGNPLYPGLRRYLITNRFSGQDDPSVFGPSRVSASAFQGEVFELSPATFNWAAPHMGYQQDYVVSANTLAPNGNASIVWRSPGETVRPEAGWFVFYRSLGDITNATFSSQPEQPAFADRPF